MYSDWRCDHDGPVLPLHVAEHIGPEILQAALGHIRARREGAPEVPVWCPWPTPAGWTVTGVGWVGDERSGARASVLACTGPAPLQGGPADMVFVAEELGVGLGTRFAGIPGPDPGPFLDGEGASCPAHARVHAAGWPTPLWSVKAAEDRCAYVGEARGLWLYAVAWPATAGYLLAEDLFLCDLAEVASPELVFGAPSPYLHGRA